MGPAAYRGPARGGVLSVTQTAMFAALIAVCSWIAIPTPYGVPFTMQTFAVFAALMTLGGRRGACAVAVYLLMGCFGVPVFSGFQSGFSVLLSPTGGYVLGFLLAALIFWLLSVRLTNAPPHGIWLCLSALLICYAAGTIWFLSLYSGNWGTKSVLTAVGVCVLPYIVPDICKIMMASALSARLRSSIGKSKI